MITQDVIKKAVDGDVDAFEQIYRYLSPYVYSICFYMTRNREDAMEVTQDVFIKSFRALSTFDFRSSLKTWVHRITVNASLNKIRSRRRVKDQEISFEDIQDIPESFSVLEQSIQIEEHRKTIDKFLAVLPDEQKTCFLLREVSELSYEEISKALKVNINTVKTRLRRARQTLMARFGQVGGEGHEMQ